MAFVYWIHHKDTTKHFNILEHGYVGITSRTVDARFKQHQNAAKFLKYPLYAAFLKYGDDLIVETVIEGSLEYCQLIEYKLRPSKNIGYNCVAGGASTTLGSKFSQETKDKISAKAKGRLVTAETRKKLSLSSSNRPPVSEDTREKLSKINKGRVLSEETKKKISEAHKGSKRNFSDSHKKNLAISKTGKTHSEDTKDKLRVAATGRKKTQESKDKFSESMTGRNLWENSAARKDLWAIAEDFRLLCTEYPNKSAKALSEILGHLNCNPWKLVEKLKSGWNPSEDASYLAWLSEYKQKQELANGT